MSSSSATLSPSSAARPAVARRPAAAAAALCTLFEGNYHVGAAALVNSLHAAGFSGRVICGHRGPPPPWAGRASRESLGFALEFVPLQTDIHLTYYKAAFLRRCWRDHCPDAAQLYYCDPDIVVKAPWHVLDRWARDGVALCEDINGYLPPRHPYRLAWTDFLAAHGLRVQRPLDRYYNAGFIGLGRADAAFLDDWQRVIDCVQAELGALAAMKVDTPNGLLPTPDQDAMNMALMISRVAINGAGPECMDFAPGGYLLSHAIGPAKPWHGGFLRRALQGHPPAPAHKAFLAFTRGPIPVLPRGRLSRLRAAATAAALLGRVYRRT